MGYCAWGQAPLLGCADVGRQGARWPSAQLAAAENSREEYREDLED